MADSSSTALHEQFRLAIAGDREALGGILTRHGSYLKMLASTQIHQRLRGKADPSDMVQETFLEAHKQIETFRGSSHAEFTGWLRGILAHLLAKHFRKYIGTQQRDIRLEQSLNQELDQASGCFERGLVAKLDSPSTKLMQNETMLALATALDALPSDYRTVIILRNIQGLPFKDVALAMEKSVDSVEKLWVRGLAKLKLEMDPQ
jgi:RNA polymerase sigma-70 factor (ECF subfamily)